MATAMLARLDGQSRCSEDFKHNDHGGTVLEYDRCTGEWVFYCGSGQVDEPVFLIFNWVVESDNVDMTALPHPGLYGGSWGYTQAAAEGLYAALRDPRYADSGVANAVDELEDMKLVGGNRSLHLVGHSRGTSVMTHTSRRIVAAGIDIDHLTLLDPHPVDGIEGDDPVDWGDRVAGVYQGVEWSDTYWRKDFSFYDFAGQLVSGSYARNLECAFPEEIPGGIDHSRVHAWYHGTIDLSAGSDEVGFGGYMITSSWYSDMDCGALGDTPSDRADPILARSVTGYNYINGISPGARPDSPNQSPRIANASLPYWLYNGNFEQYKFLTGHFWSHAGWRYHGGSKQGDGWDNDPVDSSNNIMILDDADEASITHDRFYLDARLDSLTFRRRRIAEGDGELEIRLLDPVSGQSVHEFNPVILSTAGGTWVVESRDIPAEFQGMSHLLEFSLSESATATVGIDDISFMPGPIPVLGTGAKWLFAVLLLTACMAAALHRQRSPARSS